MTRRQGAQLAHFTDVFALGQRAADLAGSMQRDLERLRTLAPVSDEAGKVATRLRRALDQYERVRRELLGGPPA